MKRKPEPEPEKRAPGAGSFRTRTDRRGRVRVQALVFDSELKKQVSIGTYDTEAEAEAAVWQWNRDRADEGVGVPRDPGILTLRQLGVLYMKALDEKKAKTARGRWKSRVEELADFIDWPVSQIGERDIRRWVDRMCRTPVATGKSAGKPPERSTIQNALNLLRDVFRWAVLEEKSFANPCKDVTIRESTLVAPKSKFGRGFDYLREDEARSVWDGKYMTIARPKGKARGALTPDGRFVLPLEVHAKLMTLMLTGARPIDVWMRRWSDVNWKRRTIDFSSRKTSQEYVVHMLPELERVLRKWWRAQGEPKDGYIFPSPDSPTGHYPSGYDAGWADKRERKWDYYQLASGEMVKKKRTKVVVTPGWRTKLGITRKVKAKNGKEVGLPLYSLRHTCASHLLLGTPLFTGGRRWSREEVQSALGHTSSKTTEHYTRSLGLTSKRAIEESRVALGEEPATP